MVQWLRLHASSAEGMGSIDLRFHKLHSQKKRGWGVGALPILARVEFS